MPEEALRRISACYAKDLDDVQTSVDDADDCPIALRLRVCIEVLHLAHQFNLYPCVLALY